MYPSLNFIHPSKGKCQRLSLKNVSFLLTSVLRFLSRFKPILYLNEKRFIRILNQVKFKVQFHSKFCVKALKFQGTFLQVHVHRK